MVEVQRCKRSLGRLDGKGIPQRRRAASKGRSVKQQHGRKPKTSQTIHPSNEPPIPIRPLPAPIRDSRSHHQAAASFISDNSSPYVQRSLEHPSRGTSPTSTPRLWPTSLLSLPAGRSFRVSPLLVMSRPPSLWRQKEGRDVFRTSWTQTMFQHRSKLAPCPRLPPLRSQLYGSSARPPRSSTRPRARDNTPQPPLHDERPPL
jgi:hypothetical protein